MWQGITTTIESLVLLGSPPGIFRKTNPGHFVGAYFEILYFQRLFLARLPVIIQPFPYY